MGKYKPATARLNLCDRTCLGFPCAIETSENGDKLQTKYKIDRNTRRLIIGYIRKYDEYKKWYEAERDRILEGSPKKPDVAPRGGALSDRVLSSVERLEKLENSHKCAVIRAIDNALLFIGRDVCDESEGRKIRNAVWLSCINAYEYPFEVFEGSIPYERRQF